MIVNGFYWKISIRYVFVSDFSLQTNAFSQVHQCGFRCFVWNRFWSKAFSHAVRSCCLENDFISIEIIFGTWMRLKCLILLPSDWIMAACADFVSVNIHRINVRCAYFPQSDCKSFVIYRIGQMKYRFARLSA